MAVRALPAAITLTSSLWEMDQWSQAPAAPSPTELLQERVDRLTLQVDRLRRHVEAVPRRYLSQEIHDIVASLQHQADWLQRHSAQVAQLDADDYRAERLSEADRTIAALDAGISKAWRSLDAQAPPRLRKGGYDATP